MLHYHKESDQTNQNPDWCGAHFDHGVFTGLMPAYYFCNGEPVAEPEEAGLFIRPSDSQQFEKMDATDKSVLLFQVGEFGQLLSNDKIKATKHKVQKAKGGIERFTFALFYSAANETVINSQSILKDDERYKSNQHADGSITYEEWQISSYARYRATS
jgi:isopenicillin N synthase-like dioxygenase